jgi:hypothetical protein
MRGLFSSSTGACLHAWMLNCGGIPMKLTTLIVAGALSAFAMTAVAAPAMKPVSSIAPDSAIELAQAKKKAAPKKAVKKKVAKKKVAKKKVAKKGGKKVAKLGPGRCGTMKYWSMKTKKCASKG